jgi:hypothetical protein
MQAAEFDNAEGQQTAADALGVRLASLFDELKAERRDYEDRWLQNLRMYRGEYGPDVHIPKGRSRAFLRLTRIKVRSMDSRLLDMLFPSGRNDSFALAATPDPDVDPEFIAEIAARYEQKVGETPPQEELENLVQEHAKQSCEAMETKIRDQLIELRYKAACRDVFHQGHLFGTGVLKGPMADYKERTGYRMTGANSYEFYREPETTPYFESVRLWDVYPDMSVTDVADAEYVYQRHVMSKQDLRGLAARADFDNQRILDYLKQIPEGDAEQQYWEEETRNINEQMDGVRQRIKGKYEVLEYWGYVDGQDLIEAGVDIDDPHVEYMANIWVLGGRTVKAVLAPYDSQRLPYYFYHYEKDDTSIFGVGVPEIGEDTQNLANAANRAMIDNAAITVGPQAEVNIDLLDADEDPRDVYPMKVWLRSGRGAEGANRAVNFFSPPNHTGQLLSMVETFRVWNDEVTGIPSYMHGDSDISGAGKTASGLSMLMSAANLTMKDAVENFDQGITVPFLKEMYSWNMKYTEEEKIKGDYEVKATGSTSLVAKEVRVQNLQNFLSLTANEGDQRLVDRRKMLETMLKEMELPEHLLRSEKETDYILQLEQAVQQMQQQMQQVMGAAADERGQV